jgi:hypothetical protein
MGLFRNKKKQNSEESNKIFEEGYKPLTKEKRQEMEINEVLSEVANLRKSNVDEDFIKDWLHSHLPDGRIKLEGKFVWICRSCETGRKFDTKENYIAHQLSYH